MPPISKTPIKITPPMAIIYGAIPVLLSKGAVQITQLAPQVVLHFIPPPSSDGPLGGNGVRSGIRPNGARFYEERTAVG